MDHSVGLRNRLVLVTQYRIIETEALGETNVGCGGITARCKKDDVVLIEAGPGRCRQVNLFPAFELDDK